MDSWTAICGWARDHYRVESDRDGRFEVVWCFATDRGEPRRQPVAVLRREGWLELVAPLAAGGELPSRAALLESTNLCAGSLALVDDAYVLRATLPAEIAAPAFARVLERLGFEAASFPFTRALPAPSAAFAEMYA